MLNHLKGYYRVVITFTPDSCGPDGLHISPPQVCPPTSVAEVGGCGPIELIYQNGQKSNGVATIIGKFQVDISPTNTTRVHQWEPVGVNYGLGDYPEMTVYNSINVPLLPFSLTLSN
jgi:hypothetical protein